MMINFGQVSDRLSDRFPIFKPLNWHDFGQVGQVRTDYSHNNANVRAIRGNGKTCPNVSKPVRPSPLANIKFWRLK